MGRISDDVNAAIAGVYRQDTNVTVRDLVEHTCAFRRFLQLTGEAMEHIPSSPELFLRVYEDVHYERIREYVQGCFGERRFVPLDPLYAADTVEVKLLGRLDGMLVDYHQVSTDVFNYGIPTLRKVESATKAGLLGENSILVILMDRDKQDWKAWTLTGDFSENAEDLRKDATYLKRLAEGRASEFGTATRAVCAECPYKQVCTAEVLPPGTSYSPEGIRVIPDSRIIEALDAYLWGLNKPRKFDNAFHPSEYTTQKCDLRLAFGLKGVERREKIDPKLRRIFNAGHSTHDVIQTALAYARKDEYRAEVRVVHEDLSIHGSCDGVSGTRGEEYKSIGLNGFKKLTGPKKEHKEQATSYVSVLELDGVDYFYVCKETGEFREYALTLDKPVWHKTASRLAAIKKTVSMGSMPSPMRAYHCNECPYAWTCK